MKLITTTDVFKHFSCKNYRQLITMLVVSLTLIHSESVFSNEKCSDLFFTGDKKKIEYGGIKYDTPLLSKESISLQPKHIQLNVNILESKVVQALQKPWDLNEFKTPRLPEPIAVIQNANSFSNTQFQRVLELPILRPGSDVKLPKEFEALKELVQKVIDTELSLNPNFHEYHAYLTVDQSTVLAGDTQRMPGVHVDGFQGVRQKIKQNPDHSYIATDSVPTVFYKQPFDYKNLDENFNYFNEMNRQAYSLTAKKLKPYTLYLMDAYSLHRADIAEVTTQRTFFRITFSKSHYDRLGETDNPAFPDTQKFPRPIPDNLKTFIPDDTNFTGTGYLPRLKNLKTSKSQNSDNNYTYASKHLGINLEDSVNKNSFVFISLGNADLARKNAELMGWKIIGEIRNKEGSHRIFKAQHENGYSGFIILNVNSPEQLIYIHSLLNLAAFPAHQVYTWGTLPK